MITIEKEIWKPVRGFEEYAEISNFGQIHRFERVYYAGRNHKINQLFLIPIFKIDGMNVKCLNYVSPCADNLNSLFFIFKSPHNLYIYI